MLGETPLANHRTDLLVIPLGMAQIQAGLKQGFPNQCIEVESTGDLQAVN